MYAETEQLLLNTAKRQDITDELKVHRNFEGDYDAKSSEAELPLLPVIFQCHPSNFEDIVQTFQCIENPSKVLSNI